MALLDVFKKKKESESEKFARKHKVRQLAEDEAKKKEKTEDDSKEKKVDKKAAKKAVDLSSSKVLIKPHVTEKATYLNEANVHVFKIASNANKIMVRQAVKKIYGVLPERINIINIPDKKKFVRGKRGAKAGYKKALVYLKKGDKIETA
ncbi:MAG: 50S ribosomal protein L23 [Candidatus Paceibacterota bacterium]